MQVNYNAYLHARGAFGGKPQRYRHVLSDFYGHVAELLAKAVRQNKLDEAVSREDKEILLEALRSWGALNPDLTYRASNRRGYERDPGGGLDGAPQLSQPIGLADLLKSGLWRALSSGYSLRIPDHHVPAGRRHGHDRQGLRARGRRRRSASTPR